MYMRKSPHRVSQERFVEAALQVEYHPYMIGRRRPTHSLDGSSFQSSRLVSLIQSATIRSITYAMESQKYHLLEGNTEEEDSRHAPRFRSLPNIEREATRRDILYLAIIGIGAFMTGMFFALTLLNLQAQVRGGGKYETGFREEGLCKSGHVGKCSPYSFALRYLV